MLHSFSAQTVGAVSELETGIQQWEHLSAASVDSRGSSEPSLSALSANDDLLNNAVPNIEHMGTLDVGKEWMISRQALTVKSTDSDADISSIITDSGVDSNTVSSRLCLSELSAVELDSGDQQNIGANPRRVLHCRSASEGGIFKSSHSFPNLSQQTYVHQRYEPGTCVFGVVYFTGMIQRFDMLH